VARTGAECNFFHFTSENDANLKFLAHGINKVDIIHEKLGSRGEVFAAAFQRRFIDLQYTNG
jgi:hypothetical protein